MISQYFNKYAFDDGGNRAQMEKARKERKLWLLKLDELFYLKNLPYRTRPADVELRSHNRVRAEITWDNFVWDGSVVRDIASGKVVQKKEDIKKIEIIIGLFVSLQ